MDQELISYDHITTHLVAVFVGATSSKKAHGSVVSNRIGMKFVRIILRANAHRLTETDFGYDVISSKRRP